MYGHFSWRAARGELCDGVTHFPFLFLFFFPRVHSPNWQQTSGSNSAWKASPGRRSGSCCRLQRGRRSTCARREMAGAASPGVGRCPCVGAELLPGCRRAATSQEPAAAGGRDAKSWLPLGCGDGHYVETNRQETVCCKAGEITIFL